MRRTEPEALATAAAAIARRRVACEDSALETLPDDPFGIIAHVRMHRRVPRDILASDHADALVLVRCLHAALNEHEHALMRGSRELGMSWRQVGAHLGLSSPQGAEQRFLRLEAWRAEEARSDKLARRQRAAAAREPVWLADNGPEIRRAAEGVVLAFGGLPSELSGTIEDLAEALEDPDLGPGALMAWLSMFTYEARYLSSSAPSCPAADRAAGLVLAWQAMR